MKQKRETGSNHAFGALCEICGEELKDCKKGHDLICSFITKSLQHREQAGGVYCWR